MLCIHRVLLVALAVIVGPGVALGAGPGAQLGAQIERVLATLEDQAIAAEERRRAIRAQADEILDFREVGRRALGPHWAARSPRQQDEFVALFREFLHRSYFSKIDQFDGEAVRIVGETVDGDSAIVRTHVVTDGGSAIDVDYRMIRAASGWRVCDVAIDGVSLVANYRAQFNKIIRSGSYDDLVRRLRAREAAAVGGE